MSLMPLLARVRQTRWAAAARRRRNEWDVAELRTARASVRSLRAGGPDIVYLGDSTNFGFNAVGDRRSVAEMLQLMMAPRSVLPVAAGGYHAAIWLPYLQLLARGGARPAVVLSLCVRTTLDPWQLHPAYHFSPQIEAVRGLTASTPLRSIHRRVEPRTAWEFALHDRLPHPTLAGDLTVGDHVRAIRSADPGTSERARWLYAHHHGGDIVRAQTGLAHVATLARFLREQGWPVVAYPAPICVERGESLLGPAFAERVRSNVDVLIDMFRQEAGDQVTVLPCSFAASDFVDPDDATEHLGPAARLRLAGEIAAALGPRNER